MSAHKVFATLELNQSPWYADYFLRNINDRQLYWHQTWVIKPRMEQYKNTKHWTMMRDDDNDHDDKCENEYYMEGKNFERS